MKLFKIVKRVFFLGLTILSNFTNALDCTSMKNEECKIRPEIVNIYSNNNPIFYPFSIEINKCSGNCNDTNDPYARVCIPDVIKNLNIRVFNLMTRTNETKHIEWHEKCKCECRLDEITCNNKQYWNEDKYRCECKKLIYKDVCDKGFIWNPSNCRCECDKSCDIGEYLDYLNCKCRKKFVDLLVEECTKNINETKLVEKTLDKNENKDKCSFYVVYKILFWTFLIFFIINLGTDISFIYYNWSLINNNDNNNNNNNNIDNIYCIKFNNHKKKRN